MRVTDIVMDTAGNRLSLLEQSIEHIIERTRSPYRLFVIDDASTDGTAAYLQELLEQGKIFKAILRKKRWGIPANWNAAARLAESDILVYTNGDVLCPKIGPSDWLRHGIKAMRHHPDIGMLSLNSPMCNAKRVLRIEGRRKGIVLTDRVPSFFLFVRRELMLKIKIPGVGGRMMGIPVRELFSKVDRIWSRAARAHGYKVGYLSGVYCKHIGLHSIRTGRNLVKWSVPCDPITLVPERHKGK